MDLIRHTVKSDRPHEACIAFVDIGEDSSDPANVKLLAEVRKGATQRCAGDMDYPCIWQYISRIRKMAPETDNAAKKKAVVTVALRGA
jgi:hypothetical protein